MDMASDDLALAAPGSFEDMSWILSLLVSLVCGAFTLVSSGVVAALYADWYHVSTREGYAGFFVVGLALLGAIAGCVLGLVIARMLGTEDSGGFFKAAGIACGVATALSGATALVLFLLADFPPKLDGEEMALEVEILLPEGVELTPSDFEGETEFVLGSVVGGTRRAVRYGELNVSAAKDEDGRWVVPGEVFLFTSRGDRVIQIRIGDSVRAAFGVPLPAHPGRENLAWSGWLPQPPPGGAPWPETEASFRFRVRRIPPPPPPPTPEEAAAQKEREEQAVFESIPDDAPITALLPYTPSWQNAARREEAIARITGRQDFTGELGRLMLSGDNREAEAALRFVGEMPAPAPALVPAVRAAGRDVIGRMERFNASTVEDDPSFEGAADVSIRFNSWMVATRALREEADFVPELSEILQLSRVRTDSHVMQQDVRRVSSYYMQEWAGVEPLPGDPPPR